MNKLKNEIEAILFAVSDVVTAEEIAVAVGVAPSQVNEVVLQLKNQYDESENGFKINIIGKGYQMCTRENYFESVRKVVGDRSKKLLSPAAMETLAVIAYNQPIIKSAIEHVRGVNSDGAVSSLVERGLVEDCGRLNAPGRPILYMTTNEFLRSFSITSIDDMPKIDNHSVGIKKEENEQLEVDF